MGTEIVSSFGVSHDGCVRRLDPEDVLHSVFIALIWAQCHWSFEIPDPPVLWAFQRAVRVGGAGMEFLCNLGICVAARIRCFIQPLVLRC